MIVLKVNDTEVERLRPYCIYESRSREKVMGFPDDCKMMLKSFGSYKNCYQEPLKINLYQGQYFIFGSDSSTMLCMKGIKRNRENGDLYCICSYNEIFENMYNLKKWGISFTTDFDISPVSDKSECYGFTQRKKWKGHYQTLKDIMGEKYDEDTSPDLSSHPGTPVIVTLNSSLFKDYCKNMLVTADLSGAELILKIFTPDFELKDGQKFCIFVTDQSQNEYFNPVFVPLNYADTSIESISFKSRKFSSDILKGIYYEFNVRKEN